MSECERTRAYSHVAKCVRGVKMRLAIKRGAADARFRDESAKYSERAKIARVPFGSVSRQTTTHRPSFSAFSTCNSHPSDRPQRRRDGGCLRAVPRHFPPSYAKQRLLIPLDGCGVHRLVRRGWLLPEAERQRECFLSPCSSLHVETASCSYPREKSRRMKFHGDRRNFNP